MIATMIAQPGINVCTVCVFRVLFVVGSRERNGWSEWWSGSAGAPRSRSDRRRTDVESADWLGRRETGQFITSTSHHVFCNIFVGMEPFGALRLLAQPHAVTRWFVLLHIDRNTIFIRIHEFQFVRIKKHLLVQVYVC